MQDIDIPANAVFPLEDNIGFVALIESMGNDTNIVNAARCSFGKRINQMEDTDIKLLKYLLKHSHLSPFEHNSFTFLIKAPLFIIQQHLRHRISSFNQVSARYVEIKEEFYIPKNFREQSKNNRQASTESINLDNQKSTKIYKDSLKFAYTKYQELLSLGVAREQARGLLPHCTYSEYYWTCNLRSFLHFIELRYHEGAQWEIQQYAKAMLNMVEKIFPVTLSLWKEMKGIE